MSPPPPPPAATNKDVGLHAVEDNASVVLPDPLTVEGVPFRRSKAGKFNGGVAAASTSDMFKGAQNLNKPLAKRWDHKITVESASRKSATLKGLARFLANPGMLSLGGGLPSSEYFPFDEISVKVPGVDDGIVPHPPLTMTITKDDVAQGKSAYDLSIALNYGQGSGSAQVIRWVVEHTEIVHNPPIRDWGCILTVGSTSATEQLYRMFLERGDYLITEEFTFATAAETAGPLGAHVVGIPMDTEGMLPDALDSILTNWNPAERHGARKPTLVYTIPTGQNPTGATASIERRRAIYALAQKHDLIIMEDEPYYFLQMQPYAGKDTEQPPPPKSHDEFLKSLVPSYLSIDIDGRVVRMDSFSKVLSPGSRTGWITAAAQLIERYVRHNEVSVQHPSGISQIILHRLLDETWGHGGYLDWLIHIRLSYTQRRNVLMHACEEYLPREVASWTPPAAGMFHWIKLDYKKHPDAGKKSIKEIEDSVLDTCVAENVLVVPGSYFKAEQEKELDQLFVRANYASAEFGQMREATRRLGVALRKCFGLEQME